MAIIDITALKTLFKKGAQPKEEHFSEFIDACYGNDQQLSYDNDTGILSISSSTSDTTPSNSVDLNALKNVSLSYNDTDNKTAVTPGNSIEIGPLKKTNNNFYLPAGNLGIGENTTTSLTEKLVINGSVRINGTGSKIYFTGEEIDGIMDDPSLGTGYSSTKLPTVHAVKKYVDDRIVQNMFHSLSNGIQGAVDYFKNLTTTPEDIVFPFNILRYSQFDTAGDRVFSLENDKFIVPSSGFYLFIVNLVIRKYYIGSNGSITIRLRQILREGTSSQVITDYIIFDSNNSLLTSSTVDPISCPISSTREAVVNTLPTTFKIIVTLRNAEIKFSNENSFICKKFPNTAGSRNYEAKSYDKLDRIIDQNA